MPDEKEYTFRAYTTRPVYMIGLDLLVLAAVLYFAWGSYATFWKDIHDPDHSTRLHAWGILFFVIWILGIIGQRFLKLFQRRQESIQGVEVQMNEVSIILTDEKGQRTESPWYALEDVLVFPPNNKDTGMVFLLAGDRSGYIPVSTKDPEELLHEILRRSELTLTQEEPSFRRYSRRVKITE